MDSWPGLMARLMDYWPASWDNGRPHCPHGKPQCCLCACVLGIGHAIGHLRRRLLGPWQTSHPVAERCPLCDGLAQAQASYAACVPMRWAKAMPPTHHSRHHLLGPGLASHPSQTATPAESGSFASIALLLSLTSAKVFKRPARMLSLRTLASPGTGRSSCHVPVCWALAMLTATPGIRLLGPWLTSHPATGRNLFE